MNDGPKETCATMIIEGVERNEERRQCQSEENMV